MSVPGHWSRGDGVEIHPTQSTERQYHWNQLFLSRARWQAAGPAALDPSQCWCHWHVGEHEESEGQANSVKRAAMVGLLRGSFLDAGCGETGMNRCGSCVR